MGTETTTETVHLLTLDGDAACGAGENVTGNYLPPGVTCSPCLNQVSVRGDRQSRRWNNDARGRCCADPLCPCDTKRGWGQYAAEGKVRR